MRLKVPLLGAKILCSLHFNPTIVRLKDCEMCSFKYRLRNFNPTIVRLKVQPTLTDEQIEQNFNPTIVRLKELCLKMKEIATILISILP